MSPKSRKNIIFLQDQRDRSIVDNSEDVPKDSNLSGDSDQDIDFGRSWEVSDLQALKSPVLQALWFVLTLFLSYFLNVISVQVTIVVYIVHDFPNF